MKPKHFILALLAQITSVSMMAYDAEIDGIYYNFSGTEATVAQNFDSYKGDIVIPSVVTYNEKEYAVTSIDKNAFYCCERLTSVHIPNSVTSIGTYAFWGCTNLSSVTIPNSVKRIGIQTFMHCRSLISISIPNGVTTIDGQAFEDCSSLTSIIIPESVISISSAFSYCSNLTSIIVEEGNTVYDSRNGCNAIIETASNTLISGCASTTIPEDVSSIEWRAFEGCSNLTSIVIPKGVTSIGYSVFAYCTALSSIIVEEGNTVYDSRNGCNAIIETASNNLISGCMNTSIPSNVTSIGDYAFAGHTGITTIDIPESVTSIGLYAFCDCYNLDSIVIPNTVTNLSGYVFFDCKNLTSVILPNNITSIKDRTFHGCSSLTSINLPNCVTEIEYGAFLDCSNLSSLNIPDNVTSIGSDAFRGCKSLTSISIPNSVRTIGYQAFCDCIELISINIPQGVTTIKNRTFGSCYKLTSVTIPNSVTCIEEYAFSYCTNLTSIVIPESVTFIAKDAFSGCSNLNSIIIHEGVKSIGEGAFGYCSSLSIVKVCMETPVNISENTFSEETYENATLYVPTGSKASYLAADIWKEFKEIIECNFVDAQDMNIETLESNSLEINLTNEATDLVAFQMDLTLPEGVSIDKAGCSLSSRITDEEQELTIGKLENGAYRLTSSSLSLTPISGQDGTLLTLELTAESGSIGGQATISNIIFSTSESEKIVMSDETFDINVLYKVVYKVENEIYQTDEFAYNTQPTIADEPTREGYTFGGWSELPELMPNHDVEITGRFYLFGDVNTDEGVDVVDVVDIARFVVATPSTQFREKLADLNRDNTVNLGDAVVLINHIAGDQNFVKARFAPAWSVERNDVLSLTQSSNSLALNLSNSRGYTALQFDLYVSNDAIVNQMMLSAERRQGHQLLYNKLETGHYRVAVLSMSNSTFQGDEGELLSFTVEGTPFAEASIRNILFFDTHANGYAFDDMSIDMVTGLHDVNINGNKDDVIYDLQGRKLPEIRRGVNIVNGKKIVVKR